MTNLKRMIQFHKGRIKLIDTIATLKENWQKNKTPMSIIDEMIEVTNIHNKDILVLFNIEFVEQLIYKFNVPKERIQLLSDTKAEQLLATKVYGIKSVIFNEQDFKQKFKKKEEHPIIQKVSEMSKKFDLVFSNPPYNRGIDLKILREVNKVVDEMVIVHPSTWLIDLKGKSKLYKDFKNEISLKSVKMFNGNPIFNIGLFVPCVITHTNKSHNDKIKVLNFDESFEVNSVDDITKFGKMWKPMVKPFMNKIKENVKTNSSVWDNNKTEIDLDKHHVQLAAIRGHEDNKSHENMVTDDFYTMVMKNSDGNKGIRLKLGKPGNPIPTFEFKTEIEQNNFIEYLKTDFARFCLALYKNNCDLSVGNMSLIPWLDFTQQWNDEKLYKQFNINKETQDYITNFLPDYHGIRK